MKKIALVLVDQKNIKLIFACAEVDKYFYIYDEIEENVDLVKDLPKGGIIKTTTINEVVKVLKMYKKLCETQKIDEVFAYAMSFVNGAKNQVSFIDEIESSSGFKFSVLSQEEEANALYLSAANTLDVARGIIVDVRNECTNIVKYFRRNILFQVSIPIGAMALAELFATPNADAVEVHQQMVDFFKTQLVDYGVTPELVEGYKFICVGNMADALFKLNVKRTKYPLNIEHSFIMTGEKYAELYKFIETLDVDSTKKIKGISDERSDVFAGAMSIFKAVFELQDEFEIYFSTYGLKEGLLFINAIPSIVEKQLLDITQYSLDALQGQYTISRGNGAKVCDLAVIIFKQLKVLHKLPRTYLKSLKVAASLYRCGEIVNYQNIHKNCFNIISNSVVFGISHKELILGAFIAENVDPDAFSLAEWVKYKDLLTEADLEALKKLSAILKIAIGLDITGSGAISDLSCDVLGDSVIMKTCAEADVSFEIKYALHGSKIFKRAFNKYLEIL